MRAAWLALALGVAAASSAGVGGVEPGVLGRYEVWVAHVENFTRVGVWVNGTGPEEAAVGVFVYGDDLAAQPFDGGVYVALATGEHRVVMQGHGIDLEAGRPSPREHRVALAPMLPGPGTAVLVVFAAAREPWSPTIEVAPLMPVRLERYAVGEDAFLARERDFAAAEHDEVMVQPHVLWARHLEKGALERSFDHGFVGVFGGWTTTGELEMGFDAPDGVHDGPLHWGRPELAGAYRFRVDHQLDAYSGLCSLCAPPLVVLAGADAPIPRVFPQR